MFALDHGDPMQLGGLPARDHDDPSGKSFVQYGLQFLSQEAGTFPRTDHQDPASERKGPDLWPVSLLGDKELRSLDLDYATHESARVNRVHRCLEEISQMGTHGFSRHVLYSSHMMPAPERQGGEAYGRGRIRLL